ADSQAAGHRVAHVHLRHLNPLPSDLEGILRRARHVLVPEVNLGQLVRVLRAEFLVPAIGYQKIQGRPFKVSELVARCTRLLAGDGAVEVQSGARHRSAARSSSPTRTCAGARAAETTRSSPRCRSCCPTSACRARTSSSSPASDARVASRTT